MIAEFLHTGWGAFSTAIRFMTVFPLPDSQPASERESGYAVLFYPIVGLIIGLVLVCLGSLFDPDSLLSAALLLTVWVAITGGLHLDGLADCADAWLGGISGREATLRILKDPRSGSMAVVVLVLFLICKLTALATLLSAGSIGILWAVPVWSRLSILPLILTTPNAREEGYGARLLEVLPRRGAAFTLAVALLALCLALPFTLWCVQFAVVILVSLMIRLLAMRRLGGITGDVMGAQVELIELGLLLALAGLCGGGL